MVCARGARARILPLQHAGQRFRNLEKAAGLGLLELFYLNWGARGDMSDG